jgi:hypothetical protein
MNQSKHKTSKGKTKLGEMNTPSVGATALLVGDAK